MPKHPKRAVLRDGQFGQAHDHEVDIELGDPTHYVGLNANLVPMPSAVAGGRVFYGSRFQTQALPIVNPEAPLVQNLSGSEQDNVLQRTIAHKHHGINTLQMRKFGADGTEDLSDVSGVVYAGLASRKSDESLATKEGELSVNGQDGASPGSFDKAAMPVRQPQLANASSGLRPATIGGMEVQNMSPGSSSESAGDNQSVGDPHSKSFDEMLGAQAGAHFADSSGVIDSVTPDEINWTDDSAAKRRTLLYANFPLNRMTRLHNTPMVKAGDNVKAGQVLAKSNFTDDKGTLAMGINARIGLVPYHGRSMEDAIVVSEDFAKRLTSDHLFTHDLDYKRGVKGGKAHFTGLFVHKYTNDQLNKLDDHGVAKPGQVLQSGDPIILATRPRVVSSGSSQLGQLSKHMRNARTPAETVWDQPTPGTVTDVIRTRHGVKVNIATQMPSQVGDKLSMRAGQKGVISHIIATEHMPRTVDGKPLEVLMNPLTVVSRMNSSMIYEMLLGKIARKTGQPYKVPPFTQPGQDWNTLVGNELRAHGMKDKEEVFDPQLGRKLENPVTVGEGFIQKMYHLSSDKMSARGQGAYDSDANQPMHGSGPEAGAKRIGGLTTHALLSAGAYGFLRDAATVRGTKNDEYWRTLREGHEPKDPGEPFAFSKFRALLTGAGMLADKLPNGKERLRFMTQKDLEEHKPIEVKTGDIVDLSTLEPKRHGLFDPALTGGQKFGYVQLPHPVPNPAAEDVVRRLLGLTEKEFREVIAGDRELPAHLLVARNKPNDTSSNSQPRPTPARPIAA